MLSNICNLNQYAFVQILTWILTKVLKYKHMSLHVRLTDDYDDKMFYDIDTRDNVIRHE
jgi:hypothetical protein